MSRIGIVVGMRAEARRVALASAGLDRADRPLVHVAGGSGARAEAGAAELARQNILGLLSFGLAGGLDPDLGTGQIVLADAVIAPDGERLAADAGWHLRVAARLQGRRSFVSAAIAGQDAIAATVRQKAALRGSTGAAVVDLESHGIARAARAAGLPFLAVRVVLDPADRAVPWAAQAGLAPDGRARMLPVLGRLARRPWQIAELVALGRLNGAALATLGRLAADLAPLGFLM